MLFCMGRPVECMYPLRTRQEQSARSACPGRSSFLSTATQSAHALKVQPTVKNGNALFSLWESCACWLCVRLVRKRKVLVHAHRKDSHICIRNICLQFF